MFFSSKRRKNLGGSEFFFISNAKECRGLLVLFSSKRRKKLGDSKCYLFLKGKIILKSLPAFFSRLKNTRGSKRYKENESRGLQVFFKGKRISGRLVLFSSKRRKNLGVS